MTIMTEPESFKTVMASRPASGGSSTSYTCLHQFRTNPDCRSSNDVGIGMRGFLGRMTNRNFGNSCPIFR